MHDGILHDATRAWCIPHRNYDPVALFVTIRPFHARRSLNPMRFCSLACIFAAAILLSGPTLRADTIPVHKANYDLASKWTSQKVARLTFDMAVIPHWLESGDRFWYTYETAQGRKYWLVDCRARSKKPLF